MIKLMVFIRAKPGISREAFIHHYETSHAPLAARLFPMFKAYRRNFLMKDAGLEASDSDLGFDVVTEIEFETEADYRAFRSKVAQPEVLKQIRDDEAKFLVTEATRTFVVETRHSTLRQAG